MSLRTKIDGLKAIWSFDNGFWLTISRLFFPSESLLIYRLRGAEIISDHSRGDANGARELLTTDMYSQFFPRMDLSIPLKILDLGASNGGFPILLHTSGWKIEKLVSVELNPGTFTRLHFNLHRNLNGTVVALNGAVTGSDRRVDVAVGEGDVSDNIYSPQKGVGAIQCSLEGLSLDTLYRRYFDGQIVDICKLDIEGAEFEVFAEPHHSCIEHCRYVIMEIHESPGRTAKSLIDALEGLGFDTARASDTHDSPVYFFANRRHALHAFRVDS